MFKNLPCLIPCIYEIIEKEKLKIKFEQKLNT